MGRPRYSCIFLYIYIFILSLSRPFFGPFTHATGCSCPNKIPFITFHHDKTPDANRTDGWKTSRSLFHHFYLFFFQEKIVVKNIRDKEIESPRFFKFYFSFFKGKKIDLVFHSKGTWLFLNERNALFNRLIH